MVAYLISDRKFRRRNCDEIVEIVIDDRRAFEAAYVILEFECRGVMPLTIKMGFERKSH